MPVRPGAPVSTVACLAAFCALQACSPGGPATTAAASSISGDAGGASSPGPVGYDDAAPPSAPAPGDAGLPAPGSGDASPPPSAGDSGAPLATLRVTLLTLGTSQYVSATGGGGSTVTAASATAGTAETFTLTDETSAALTDGDTVHLAASSGAYFSAAGGGGGNLTADATTVGVDETFLVHRIAGPGAVAAGDQVAFETRSKVNYISAINGGGGAVEANAPWAKGWETFTLGVAGATPPTTSTAKQKVLAYIASIKGKQTVSGQHNKNNPTPTDGTDQVTSITGKQAGLWSADFGFGQGALDARPLMITQAQTEWKKGSIVQLMYHNCIPTRDELCSWDDIGGASPQHLTDAQWTDLVTDGGTLNQAWKARLDTLSVFFAQLKAAGVAPLFRPLHEMNQPVFWWAGRPGATGTRRLYQITHDYLAGTKGFDNIIWVWDVQDFSTLGTDVTDYDPGPSYYDIAALDIYDGGYDQSKYTTMQGVAGAKPIAIGECQTPPTSAELSQQPDWAFFMLWPDFISQNAGALPGLYGASNVVTLGQMPGW